MNARREVGGWEGGDEMGVRQEGNGCAHANASMCLDMQPEMVRCVRAVALKEVAG